MAKCNQLTPLSFKGLSNVCCLCVCSCRLTMSMSRRCFAKSNVRFCTWCYKSVNCVLLFDTSSWFLAFSLLIVYPSARITFWWYYVFTLICLSVCPSVCAAQKFVNAIFLYMTPPQNFITFTVSVHFATYMTWVDSDVKRAKVKVVTTPYMVKKGEAFGMTAPHQVLTSVCYISFCDFLLSISY